MSDNEAKNLKLKMPTRHLYDQDDPEPIFEAPTPLRHNRSLPDDIGQWRKERKYFTSASSTIDNNQLFTPEPESNAGPCISPASNPSFYPSFRMHRKNSISQSNVEKIDKNKIDNQTEPYKIMNEPGLGEMVLRRGFSVAPMGKISSYDQNLKLDKSISVPGSAEPSPIHRTMSPRLFTDYVFSGFFGTGTSKKVEISDFDISVYAPTSM